MFDFLRWRSWLKDQSDRLAADGFATRYHSNDKYLRGTSLGLETTERISSFANWENGWVDFEVLDVATGEFLISKSGISVNDQNFAEVFAEYERLARKGN